MYILGGAWCYALLLLSSISHSSAFTHFQSPHKLTVSLRTRETTTTVCVPNRQSQCNVPLSWTILPTGRQSCTIYKSSVEGLAQTLGESLFRYNGQVPFLEALGINVFLFALFRPKLLSALTPPGFAHALALGTLLWSTLGWRGWSYCVLYLVLGQLVTKVKFQEKKDRGLAEGRDGRRGPENVWGSALTSLLCAACSVQGVSYFGVSSDLYLLGFVAALATKLADTFASEIGKAYGKTTFLITTLERVEPGTEGAVSAEGTAAAVVGGLLLSLSGYALDLLDTPVQVAVATSAAFLATNAESVIGATLQGKRGLTFLTNEVVNFLNTLIGGVLAIAAGRYMLGM